MRLVVIHADGISPHDPAGELLRSVFLDRALNAVVVERLRALPFAGRAGRALFGRCAARFVIPSGWCSAGKAPRGITATDGQSLPLDDRFIGAAALNLWSVISDGRYHTQLNADLLQTALAGRDTDVVLAHANPAMLAYREKVRLAGDGRLVGVRRLHCDSMEPASVPVNWPHHVFLRTQAIRLLLQGGPIPAAFPAFLERCRSAGLKVSSIQLAGTVLDLSAAAGVLTLCAQVIWSSQRPLGSRLRRIDGRGMLPDVSEGSIPDSRKFLGPVLLGRDVQIGPDVIVVGPSVIGNGVRIEAGAVIRESVVGSDSTIAAHDLVECQVFMPRRTFAAGSSPAGSGWMDPPSDGPRRARAGHCGTFRAWPRFSYAGFFKRLVDVIVAVVVLVLFAPVIPFIALAVKLNSRGPAFYRDRRQGLHGHPFRCIKFRTMKVGADQMQDTLRFVSEVDGPQFKMADDPRISSVGRFLRETYLDEIPQFFNVLRGQMSVVGPRPSPESENTRCPFWRDARLSVRPGITGLWQVHRTRQPLKDFQEWIYYDTQYVRELCLTTDLRICWQTFTKMVHNFVSQF